MIYLPRSFTCLSFWTLSFVTSLTAGPLIDIGSKRELFADRYLVETLHGDVELRLHHPVPREIVLEHDAPWEGPGSGYHSIFHDGEKYRMYYKAMKMDIVDNQLIPSSNRFLCYAESKDGIHWQKPSLGLFDFGGNTNNNIVIAEGGDWGGLRPDGAHAAVFI